MKYDKETIKVMKEIYTPCIKYLKNRIFELETKILFYEIESGVNIDKEIKIKF